MKDRRASNGSPSVFERKPNGERIGDRSVTGKTKNVKNRVMPVILPRRYCFFPLFVV